ncbi:MAG: hypothetical protein ACEQR8_07280 [Cypionkella sp.]
MIALLLVALFATVALTSVWAVADAAVRSRNAFRLLRGDLARIDAARRVSVSFADDGKVLPLPPLRSLAVSARRRAARQARAAFPRRVAA